MSEIWAAQQLGGKSSHVFDILKAVAQVTDEGVVDMLEHSSLADNISNAFRFDNYSKGLLVGYAIPIPLPGRLLCPAAL